MEVDHHDASLPKHIRNNYENLFLATKHCNGHKLDHPTKDEKAFGLRFLNPCKEDDYGEQIFEDPETFKLWGTTPNAKFHIRYLDLNAPHLIRERESRHTFMKIVDANFIRFTGNNGLDESTALKGIQKFKEEVAQMIPPIMQRRQPTSPDKGA